MDQYTFLYLPLYRSDPERFLQALDVITKDKTVILFDMFENSYINAQESIVIRTLQNELERRGLRHFIVLDGLYDNHQIEKNKNIIFFNWGLIHTYHSLIIKGHSYSTEYSSGDNKGLFLIGKPDKPHRIGLLKKFYESNKLDSILWSLNVNDSLKQKIKDDYFSEYTSEEFDKFIVNCTKTLDYKFTGSVFAHIGFPYDTALYQNTRFSIVSETWATGYTANEGNIDRPLITEKTWRAIANHHPFIMLGPQYNITWLDNKGFDTFTEYMPILYNNISDLDRRMQAIVTNAFHFSKINKNVESRLRNIVKHNHELFLRLGKKAIDDFLKPLNENIDFLESVIKFHDGPKRDRLPV